MRTRNRDRTPEFVTTPGVPPAQTSTPRAPRFGVNRTQPSQRKVSNAEFQRSMDMIAQLVAFLDCRFDDVGSVFSLSEII